MLKFRIIFPVVLSVLSVLLYQPIAIAKTDPLDLDVEIPYTLHKLKNGLTLIVHEDHKAPIVAVNIWYHVGSKNEKRGRTGFAHLYEHLMFQGSENHDLDYIKTLEGFGATNLNGTTSRDRTNYFQNIPVTALDSVLWLESDRMGNLLGVITQEKLDEQRGVVQNEKRQGENAPYGKAGEIQYKSIYPSHHPYSWTTIGSMEDLNAASLDDVKNWFRTYYGAANTVLVIAGDINTPEVIKKVEYYFGNVESGPPLTKHKSWPAKLSGKQIEISYDRVPQTMMLKSWNIGGSMSRDTNLLSMIASVMSSGKNSRLYKRLVYKEQLATSVQAYISAGEIAGTFEILAMIKPGVNEALVDNIVEEELDRFLREGPTKKELAQVRIQTFSGFVRGTEKIGGFGGKSDILASNYVYTKDPHYYKKELNWIRTAAAQDLKQVANKWLSDGQYHLEVRPFKEGQTNQTKIERKSVPLPGIPPKAGFDKFERSRLKNGLEVVLARRSAVPVVQIQLSLDAGYASDQFATPGVASLAMNMLDEGTKSRNALEISEDLIMLGASVQTGSNLDTSFVTLSSLKSTLTEALDIFSEIVLEPSYPESELQRLKQLQLTKIKKEQTTPFSTALRVFPELIYGKGHAYSNPLTGSGTLESVSDIDIDDLKQFHNTWFKPNHATMIVVGDTTMEEILPQLESRFSSWKADKTPQKNISNVNRRKSPQIFLVDKPDAPQSFLLAGLIATPKANPDEIASIAMNSIIGGAFGSRINMNLREDKHWSYGSSSGFISARGQRIFYVLAAVQTDKTSESIQEVMKELDNYLGGKPTTAEELDRTIKSESLSLAGKWESAGAVLGSLSQMVQYGLAEDYFDSYAANVSKLTLKDINAIARKIIYPQSFVWVVVGDRKKTQEKLSQLGYGPVVLIDADGNLL